MAIAGGFSPTQLKKYSKVRGENVKYVKFHHLVSNLKVKRKVGSCLGKKITPLFLLGQKISPKNQSFLQNQFSLPQPNDSSKKILGAAKVFAAYIPQIPNQPLHRNDRRTPTKNAGVFSYHVLHALWRVFFSFFPRYRSLH